MRTSRRDALVPFLVGCVIALALWGLAEQVNRSHTRAVTNCQQVQKVYGVIQAVLQQQLKTLGVKGGPGYAYYRAHPGELAVARLQARQEIRQFQPRGC